jgi:Flp pilus assembly protein TadG
MLRCRSGKREKGAVAVETAFVSMLLISILYSIAETSFLLRDGMVVSSASRAGARIASSLPRTPGYATQAKDQVEDAMAGMQTSRINKVWIFKADASTGARPAACTTSCLSYTGTSGTLVANGGSWGESSQNACAGEQDQLGVYVEYRYPSRLGFLFNNKILGETTVMRLEPYTSLGACKP